VCAVPRRRGVRGDHNGQDPSLLHLVPTRPSPCICPCPARRPPSLRRLARRPGLNDSSARSRRTRVRCWRCSCIQCRSSSSRRRRTRTSTCGILRLRAIRPSCEVVRGLKVCPAAATLLCTLTGAPGAAGARDRGESFGLAQGPADLRGQLCWDGWQGRGNRVVRR
jgi:hypothetical protein